MASRNDAYDHLTEVVLNNLQHQQGWTALETHKSSSRPRTLLSGLPPRRLYIHPDEQVEIMKAEKALGSDKRLPQPPEYEWVLPLHLAEKASVAQFASVFDSVDSLPPAAAMELRQEYAEGEQWKLWRGPKRKKRIVIAIVEDDSTVVYYVLHDGIVKPRQN